MGNLNIKLKCVYTMEFKKDSGHSSVEACSPSKPDHIQSRNPNRDECHFTVPILT